MRLIAIMHVINFLTDDDDTDISIKLMNLINSTRVVVDPMGHAMDANINVLGKCKSLSVKKLSWFLDLFCSIIVEKLLIYTMRACLRCTMQEGLAIFVSTF